MTTTTGNLIDRVYAAYEDLLGSREAARKVVQGLLAAIAEDLVRGRDVHLAHLGMLKVHDRQARKTVFGKPNPRAGQTIRQVTFRDGAALSRAMNG